MCARKPRVLHVITTLDRGGAEMQLLRLCRFHRSGFDLAVAHLKGQGELVGEFEGLGVPTRFLGLRAPLDPQAAWRLLHWVRRLKPDLIVTHLFRADFYGALVAGAAGIPLVSHKHNEDLYIRRPVWRALARTVALQARRLVMVSRAVEEFWRREAGLPADRCVCVPHGVEVPPEAAANGPARRLWPGPVWVIGTAARLTRQKGVDILLHALARLRAWEGRYRGIILGAGEEEARLRALAARLGLADAVRFLGRRADAAAWLGSLDVFVLASRWEGLGVVLLEAMARGRPVVATRVGGIREVVVDGETGLLVPPEDPAALAAAVHTLMVDPERRRHLGAAARERVRRAFSPAAMAATLSRVYREAMAPRR